MTQRLFDRKIDLRMTIFSWARWGLILALTLVGGPVQSAPEEFWGRWESPRIQVLREGDPLLQWQPGRHWRFPFRLFQTTFFKPDTKPLKTSKTGCHSDDLEEALRGASGALAQATLLGRMFEQCSGEWETGVRDPLRNSLRILRWKMDIEGHPLLRRVALRLPGGGTLKAILALKGDSVRRPFVVVRLGIFSTVEEFLAERYLLMQLFEQGPFNLLVVENITGADHVANNPGFSMGGLVEGFQNLQIARMLRDPAEPLASLVGSLQFVGVSLGSHGLFHAAALAPRQAGPPLIDGFLGICPLVHMKETFDASLRPGFSGVMMDWWLGQRLAGLLERAKDLPSGWSRWWTRRPVLLPALMEKMARDHKWNPAWGEGLSVPEHWKGDFWKASDPWPLWPAKHPHFLVIANKNDDLVPPSLNAERLRVSEPRPDLGVVMLDQGFHCTLPVAYKWDVISAMVNGLLLSRARAQETVTTLDVELESEVPVEVAKLPHDVDYEVAWPEQGAFVTLKFEVRHEQGVSHFSLNLPVAQFDFHPPASDGGSALRDSIERWLQRRLRVDLMSKDGRSILRVQWPRFQPG